MSYKTILVHLADNTRRQALMSAAIGLARTFDAHLIGLTVQPPIIVAPGMDSGPAVIIEGHRVDYAKEIDRLKTAFDTAMQGQTFGSEWREADAAYDNAVAQIVEHGRCADLIVTSQKDAKWHYSEALEEPDRLVIESGRPVLLLPKSGEIQDFGKRIVVAWNARREAARAVFDALPLLKKADEVVVVWINPQEDGEAAGELPGIDICATLARHGVKCEANQNIRPSTDVGETLLATVKNNAADMLVMGCYGHSRMREFVFGGATRYILHHMTVPVLMAH